MFERADAFVQVLDADELGAAWSEEPARNPNPSEAVRSSPESARTGRRASSLQTFTHSMQPLQVYGFTVMESRPPLLFCFFSRTLQ